MNGRLLDKHTDRLGLYRPFRTRYLLLIKYIRDDFIQRTEEEDPEIGCEFLSVEEDGYRRFYHLYHVKTNKLYTYLFDFELLEIPRRMELLNVQKMDIYFPRIYPLVEAVKRLDNLIIPTFTWTPSKYANSYSFIFKDSSGNTLTFTHKDIVYKGNRLGEIKIESPKSPNLCYNRVVRDLVYDPVYIWQCLTHCFNVEIITRLIWEGEVKAVITLDNIDRDEPSTHCTALGEETKVFRCTVASNNASISYIFHENDYKPTLPELRNNPHYPITLLAHLSFILFLRFLYEESSDHAIILYLRWLKHLSKMCTKTDLPFFDGIPVEYRLIYDSYFQRYETFVIERLDEEPKPFNIIYLPKTFKE